MRFEISSPTRAYIYDASSKELEDLSEELTYTNTAAAHDVKRHYNNKWLRSKDNEAWQKRLDFLKSKVKRTLVFDDEEGKSYILPGSLAYLPKYEVKNTTVYPVPKKVPWAKPLPFELHPYQEESWTELLKILHGNVELCTSAGKSAIILKLCRETGFRSAIVAPSKSIFRELLKAFEFHFGKAMVGYYGDGKKKIGKKFTICISDSLVNIEPGTEEWKFFNGLDMMVVDESHTWGAETLENICHGILADIPYRFFMSGTQTRGDGAEKLLQSIIGKTVVILTTAQALAGGYISDHDFTIIDVESSNPNYNDADPLVMKRIHFLNNRNIAAFTAKLANASALAFGTQTLVLVEELSQIEMLIPLLKVPYAYAHSETNKVRLASMGMEKADTEEAVEKFNKNEVKVLIGTSCIATGTNIYPTHNTANWVGGGSEIKTKQGTVGRSVRKHDQNPYKDKCVKKTKTKIYDFNIVDVPALDRQLAMRILCYRESGTEIKRIKLNK